MKGIPLRIIQALDAADTMLRCFPETSTNANGTKPHMTTSRALGLVHNALVMCGAPTTSYVHPPIPMRQFDWCAFWDEEGKVGWGSTEAEAIANLWEIAS